MTNPVKSINHCRFILVGSSDRSLTYSFGITVALYNSSDELVAPVSSDVTALTNALTNWILAPGTGATNAMGWYLGQNVSRATNQGLLTLSDISNALGVGTDAGSPWNDVPFTVPAGSSAQPWPEQVCQTIAWRADYGSDPEYGSHVRPRADDRNRMYFGPLSSVVAAVDSEVPERVKFTSGFLDDVSANFNQLSVNLNGDDGGPTGNQWLIVAWSRKEAAVKPIFDFSQQLYPTTQRRRIDSRPPLVWTPIS